VVVGFICIYIVNVCSAFLLALALTAALFNRIHCGLVNDVFFGELGASVLGARISTSGNGKQDGKVNLHGVLLEVLVGTAAREFLPPGIDLAGSPSYFSMSFIDFNMNTCS
jgi:hypothetical protein